MWTARPRPSDTSRPGHSATGWLALIAALAGVIGLRPGLAAVRDWQPATVLSDESREQVNSSPFALILGELRVTTADLMWIKTERYLHRGVSFKPHLDAAALANSGQVVNADAEYDHHEDDAAKGETHEHHEVPLVPDRATDYRGFIGVIQRNVQPWQTAAEHHTHEAGDELIPWYRVLTLSDPHHVRGYLTGAWWLMKQETAEPGSLGQATAFIEEGIRNNPRDFQLHLMRGRVLLAQERHGEAVEAFRRSAQLALKIRPPDGKDKPPVWTYWEEEDFSAAVHYVPALCYAKLRDPEATRQALAWARSLLPADSRLAMLQRQFEARPEGAAPVE